MNCKVCGVSLYSTSRICVDCANQKLFGSKGPATENIFSEIFSTKRLLRKLILLITLFGIIALIFKIIIESNSNDWVIKRNILNHSLDQDFIARLLAAAESLHDKDDALASDPARAVTNFLIVAGVSGPEGLSAWQVNSWFETEPKWEKLPLSDPAQAPAGSILTYSRHDTIGGSAEFGHVEIADGQGLFYAGTVSDLPGATIIGNFDGHAWVYTK